MVFWTVQDLFNLILNQAAGGTGLTALHQAQLFRNSFDIGLQLGAVANTCMACGPFQITPDTVKAAHPGHRGRSYSDAATKSDFLLSNCWGGRYYSNTVWNLDLPCVLDRMGVSREREWGKGIENAMERWHVGGGPGGGGIDNSGTGASGCESRG
jgi:hypothetical protein